MSNRLPTFQTREEAADKFYGGYAPGSRDFISRRYATFPLLGDNYDKTDDISFGLFGKIVALS